MADYLVFTKTYGILRKRDDNVKAARKWAKRALGSEAVSVVREHRGGTTVAELEIEWRAIVAQRAGSFASFAR
jgi:hypothetical protein